MKEFTSAVEDAATEDDALDKYTEFKVDGRVLRAYQPNPEQLTFMLAALGRGQAQETRFASIINLMMSTLRGDDQDYMEARLLERDPAKRLKIQMLEGIFEYLMEEWFATPTQEPSASVSSPPSDGQNSTPTTTPSPEV